MANFLYKLVSACMSLCALVHCVPLCSKPPDSQLSAHLITVGGNSTFAMDPWVAHESMDISPEEFQSLMNAEHLYGDSQCPTKPPAVGVQSALHERGTCPWYYVVNHLPTRFPSTLAEAKCRCENCLRKTGPNSVAPTSSNGCEPVYYSVRVLVQTGNCVDGYYEYVAQYQKIAVGCTCALPNVSASAPQPTDPASSAGGPPMASK